MSKEILRRCRHVLADDSRLDDILGKIDKMDRILLAMRIPHTPIHQNGIKFLDRAECMPLSGSSSSWNTHQRERNHSPASPSLNATCPSSITIPPRLLCFERLTSRLRSCITLCTVMDLMITRTAWLIVPVAWEFSLINPKKFSEQWVPTQKNDKFDLHSVRTQWRQDSNLIGAARLGIQ
jgi:hypothetical protein